MKKLYSILLSFVLVLSMSSVALAVTPTTFWDGDIWTPPGTTMDYSTIPMWKSYSPVGGPTTAFNFTIEKIGVELPGEDVTYENMPVPTIVNPVNFPLGTAATQLSTSINLPAYANVGIYSYLIRETIPAPPVPWVTYDTRAMVLKVTVIQGATADTFIRIPVFRFATWDPTEEEWIIAEAKGGEFDNDYNAGSITLEKQVTGNLGELARYFKFTVTFTDPSGFNADNLVTISPTSYDYDSETDGIQTLTSHPIDGIPFNIYLKDDEVVTFSNIPYGVTYTIVEEDLADYIETPSVPQSGTINSALRPLSFENNKNTTVDTGISLDSLPYILLLGFAVGGMGVLFFRKRRNASF